MLEEAKVKGKMESKKEKRHQWVKIRATEKGRTQVRLHKSIFNMKTPSVENCQRVKKKPAGKYESPTDQLLSPCSKKLNDYKVKFIASKSTPMRLSFNSGN